MSDRTKDLLELLETRILILDGAMGTALQTEELSAADFGGPDLEGCNENLARSCPQVVQRIHEAYLEAGADMVETDTFGGTPLVLAEYGLAEEAGEINRRAAVLARKACRKYSTTGRPRFAAGSMGPTTKSISVTGGITFRELEQHFFVQALGLLEGGVDVLLLETTQDTRNLKAGFLAAERAMAEASRAVPIMVSATVETMGTLLAGQSIEALYTSVMHQPLLSVGLNCGSGPEFMGGHLRSLSQIAKTRVSCYPNAGLPDEDGNYHVSPDAFSEQMARFASAGWLNMAGGCCGTTPEHIRALAGALAGLPPRRAADHHRTFLSGIDFLEITQDNKPVLVGERTNVLGSRRFKRLVTEGDFETAAELARSQVQAGAQILDICLQDPERDEKRDMEAFLESAVRVVKDPLMIDSTDSEVIETALTYSQGKAVINSINLENGEERFDRVVPLALKYGAALVVGAIDEDPVQGMAVTRHRKLEIAERSHHLLTGKFGFPEEDIFFDPLVFPCGTGNESYTGSAEETIEGLALIKSRFPGCRTILGVSNVSFGLPASGREVLNSVFLYHATKAGLDAAIVNTEKILRFGLIPEEERRLSEDLIFNRGSDSLAAFAAHFRKKAPRSAQKPERAGTPLERLPRYIVQGSKDGLVEDLEAVRSQGMPPLEIINGPLMDGMAEVGRLFNNNELIVAEVLQSAEAMKAAVSTLEPFMEKTDRDGNGTVILATVKGDVHDIGKNLVDIILSNNGYRVINLGIKVTPEKLIEAARRRRPDAIGLSGLLVKSARQMVATAEDLTAAGIRIPMLVGGAALTEKFTDLKIAPAYGDFVIYARDAMKGLDLLNRIRDPAKYAALKRDCEARRNERRGQETSPEESRPEPPRTRSRSVEVVKPVRPPDLEEHLYKDIPLQEILPYLNPVMLYSKHLGFRGNFKRRLQQGDPKARQLKSLVDDIVDKGLIHCRALFRFFGARSVDNSILLEGSGIRTKLEFPRQRRSSNLCVADFVHPQGGDSVAMFVTTAGEGIRERAEALKHDGEYLQCHALQALALETAEAAAEWVHRLIRERWGFPDPPGMTMAERFQARYRGIRYSFGYPACPNLEGQRLLFQLLKPGRIGVSLTEGFMMDPEASVSAVVVHHPQAVYFSM